MSMILAGGLSGLGKGLVEMANQRREDSLMALKRQWQIEDRNEERAYRDSVRNEERSYRRGLIEEERQRGAAHASRIADLVVGDPMERLVEATEAGGYSTLFGNSEREGGKFAGIDVTKMTLDQLSEFQSPKGEYGGWVAYELGRTGQRQRVATPVGKYQIVGTTLRQAAKEMGLPGDTVFTEEVQDAIFDHLMQKRLASADTPAGKRNAMRQEWEGFKNVSDEVLDAAIAEYEGRDQRREAVELYASPDTSAAQREVLRARGFGVDLGGGSGKLTGEEWIPDGSGKEVLHGRDENGRMVPYSDAAGDPVTRPTREKPEDVELSAAAELRIRRSLEDDLGEADDLEVDAVAGEVKRLMQDGMAAREAERSALDRMIRGDDGRFTGEFREIGEETAPEEPPSAAPEPETGRLRGLMAEGVSTTRDVLRGVFGDGQATAADRPAPDAAEVPQDPAVIVRMLNAGQLTMEQAQRAAEIGGIPQEEIVKALPQPKSQAEYEALPSGAYYVHPDGTVKRKG